MNVTVDSVPEGALRCFEVSGPRYTTFPTADRFVEAYTADHHIQALRQRRSGLANRFMPLSLYVHIPFCESLCYFCACNKVITKRHDHAAAYLGYLEREVQLHIEHVGSGQNISQLYLGGGSPTFFTDSELRSLVSMLRRNFKFSAVGDYTIEIDPRTMAVERLDVLAELGFNHLSFGLQDFDPGVQKAVHRVQSTEKIFGLMTAARARGFDSIGVDLIYGLPRQTPESFAHTLVQVMQLRPDRIALYGYTHKPELIKPQRRIHVTDLPDSADKLTLLSQSLATLLSAGYMHVGMDHFALVDDALAIAKRQGRLHRNMQGYSAQPDCDTIGLGVSSIGRVGATYSQNAQSLDEYCDLLDQGRLPVVRGLALTRDDLVRRAVIMSVMCQGQVQIESIELAYLLDFRSYFARELEDLQAFVEQGLVTMDAADIQVTAKGWLFVRVVARVFDRYLQSDHNRAQFSKII